MLSNSKTKKTDQTYDQTFIILSLISCVIIIIMIFFFYRQKLGPTY